MIVSGTQVEGGALAWVFGPCEGEELCTAKNGTQKAYLAGKKGRVAVFT